MRKFITVFTGCCCLCVLATACSNLGNSTGKNDAVVSLDLPAALFASETTTVSTEYTVTARLSDADSGEVVETLSDTVVSGDSVTLTFSPVAAGRAVILSISVYDNDSKTLYMSGSSARYVVVEGDQSLDITLTKAGGGETTGTGIINGTAKYADGNTSSEGIVVFIEKNETAAAGSSFALSQKNISTVSARSASASTSTTADYVINNAVAIAQTGSDGKFEFTKLAAGSYTVYAVSSNISLDRAAYSTITITDGDSQTVSLELTATGSISGTVLLNGNTTGNSGIFVYVPGTSWIALTGDSGSFTIANVPVSSTAYALAVSYNGKVRTFAAGSDSATTVTVTAGSTVNAGTMSLATTGIKHYFTDSSGTVSTTNYVQATKNGLMFVLTDLPDNTVAFGLGFSGYTDASGTYHDFYGDFYVDKVDYGKTVAEQKDITTLAYIYKLVSPDVTYKNVYVVLFDSTWTQLVKYSAENVLSIGGYGSISVSNTNELSLNWDPDTFTLSMSGVPGLDLDNYYGDTVASYYCEMQITASDGTSDTFSEENYNEMSIVLTDKLSASMLEKICGKSDVKMSVAYKVKLKEDMSDTRENSSNYNIYGITLKNQTVNAFAPTITLDANGGTFTPVSGGTAVSALTISSDSSGTALTTEMTFAEVKSILDAVYTLSYTTGGISADDSPYCTDSSGAVISVSDTTKTLGYTNYKIVFHWTLHLTSDNYGTGWTGTYATKDSTNTISLSSTLIAAYTASSSAVLTVTATGSPSVYYEYNGTKYYLSCDSSSGSTYIYTLPLSYDMYITGSDVTISSVTIASQN
jgi:hypothetical protein